MQALTGVGEAAGLVHVLDVVLQDPAPVLLDEVYWVARAPSDPEQVQLQMHEVGIGLVGQDVVGGPRRVVGQPEELPVVVVVAKLQPRVLGHAAGQVQVARERPPRRGGASHLTGAEVDPEERVHDVGRPQRVGVGERGSPSGRVEWLRDEDVAGCRHDVIGVQHRLELRDGPADEARVLDPRVADRMELGDRALEGRWRAGHGA